jgi:hypothetical protein
VWISLFRRVTEWGLLCPKHTETEDGLSSFCNNQGA